MSPKLELCFKCNEPTGKAGYCEDSLYDDVGYGPYCEVCRELNLSMFADYAADLKYEGEQA